jgi:hypothetical protein
MVGVEEIGDAGFAAPLEAFDLKNSGMREDSSPIRAHGRTADSTGRASEPRNQRAGVLADQGASTDS